MRDLNKQYPDGWAEYEDAGKPSAVMVFIFLSAIFGGMIWGAFIYWLLSL